MRLPTFLASAICLLLASTAQSIEWEPIGLSGGGGMFTPAVSPADGKVMMVNCDMSAAYISADGGHNWRMIHHAQLRGNTRCRPAFHPTDPKIIYAASGWSGGLKISRDQGVHWEAIGNLPRGPQGEIAIDPTQPDRMLAGAADAVYLSTDAGKTWAKCAGPAGKPVSFHFDQSTPRDRRVCFAATASAIWRSGDGGATWAEKCAGLPWRDIRSFSGGSKANSAILYCAIPSKLDDGKLAGGVFRSTDRGESWQSAMAPSINMETKAFDEWAHGPIAQYMHVLTTNANPSIVYALNTDTGIPPPHHASVYRSDDAGKSWRATYYPDPRWQPFNVEQDYITVGVKQFYTESFLGAAINPANPDQLMHTGGMRCYITDDGGKTWFSGHSRRASAAAATGKDQPPFVCNGLVVTTTWNYYIDPFEANRHYIAYTDIGFARSLDAGKTWRWWSAEARAPWSNTCYELAFDPKIPGKIWGAFSNVHDIPNYNIIGGSHRSTAPGGVCLSTDFALSWKKSNTGQPAAACTSIILDPKSPEGNRTLYAGFFGPGVYKSADDGKTWSACNSGLAGGVEENRRVCRVQLHPDGTLFALITTIRRGGQWLTDGVGLWRSRDGAKTWELANRSQPLVWPKDFTLDPKDSRIIYLSAARPDRADPDPPYQAGLYRTTDAGLTWTRLASKGPEHFSAFLHPKRPGWIYLTLTEGPPDSGLWLSRDDGATWSPIDGIPFSNIQRIAFDPADDSVIYVTTFGGSVWRGRIEDRG